MYSLLDELSVGACETLCLGVQFTTVITVDSTWLGEEGGGVRGIDGREEEKGGRRKGKGGEGRGGEGERGEGR